MMRYVNATHTFFLQYISTVFLSSSGKIEKLNNLRFLNNHRDITEISQRLMDCASKAFLVISEILSSLCIMLFVIIRFFSALGRDKDIIYIFFVGIYDILIIPCYLRMIQVFSFLAILIWLFFCSICLNNKFLSFFLIILWQLFKEISW